MSKLVMAIGPRHLTAATSYASAACSSVSKPPRYTCSRAAFQRVQCTTLAAWAVRFVTECRVHHVHLWPPARRWFSTSAMRDAVAGGVLLLGREARRETGQLAAHPLANGRQILVSVRVVIQVEAALNSMCGADTPACQSPRCGSQSGRCGSGASRHGTCSWTGCRSACRRPCQATF